MCGIVAIVSPHAKRYTSALQRMLDALRHRGPDACGCWGEDECLLGHTRLSIVDLQTGSQPMRSADGKLAVTFNGEIYGYRALRETLEYPYQNESDTEVLLAAYRAYGADLCGHIPGMFAFALWDEERCQLVCGRDRFGEKPLYYARVDAHTLMVASEIKSLLRSGLVQPRLNRCAVAAYLELRYIPEGMTAFENIHQLPPGNTLLFQRGDLRITPYWNLPPPSDNLPSKEEAAEELRMRLSEAVRLCRVADVEVGLLLSGGLDSATIAALAARQYPIQAFSFGFEGERNELPYARAVANLHGIPLQEISSSSMDIPTLMEELPDIYDEPLADTSCLPTALLCRHVRQHVKVALAGDGGDELLAGYNWYARLLASAESRTGIPESWSRVAATHRNNMRICTDEEIRLAGLEPYTAIPPSFHTNTLDDALRMDLLGFLPSDILRKTDRASMACGLELRSPFLVPTVAEFLIGLPWQWKRSQTQGKILLREAFTNVWPSCLVTRGKQGFGADAHQWLTRDDMRDFNAAYLSDSSLGIHDVFLPKWISRHSRETSLITWMILIFSVWYESVRKACVETL